jgi:hypothetical protein
VVRELVSTAGTCAEPSTEWKELEGAGGTSKVYIRMPDFARPRGAEAPNARTTERDVLSRATCHANYPCQLRQLRAREGKSAYSPLIRECSRMRRIDLSDRAKTSERRRSRVRCIERRCSRIERSRLPPNSASVVIESSDNSHEVGNILLEGAARQFVASCLRRDNRAIKLFISPLRPFRARCTFVLSNDNLDATC